MSLFSVDLPHRFMFKTGGEKWDGSKEQELEDYLNELSTAIEDQFRRLHTRQADTADSPTDGNILTVDEDGGIVDSGKSDSDYAHIAGSETFTGEKTFSIFPITPSAAPDADYEVANKKYCDDTFLPLAGGTMTGDIDFDQNEAKQLVIENRTSDPTSPATGEIWFRTDV